MTTRSFQTPSPHPGLGCAGEDDVMTFVVELGPPTYAIQGADGRELSDRWEEAVRMKDRVRAIWERC